MMNGTMRHEILRNVRCSRSLVIPTSLEKSEHTLAVTVANSVFLAYSRRTAGQLLLFLHINSSHVFPNSRHLLAKSRQNLAKLHLVRALALAKCARGHPNFVPEGGREVGLVVKAKAVANLGQRELALEQQVLRGGNPPPQDVLMRWQTQALDKEPLKLPRTHTHDFSQPVKARIAGQIGFDVLENLPQPS